MIARTNWISSVVCTLAVVASTSLLAQDNPVEINASLVESEEAANHYTVKVILTLKEGWHTYDKVPEGNPSPSTNVELTLVDSIKAVGEWKRPVGLPYPQQPGSTIFEGIAAFKQEIKAEPHEQEREIEIEVTYQVCNDSMCFPPKTATMSVTVPASKSSDKNDSEFVFEHKLFEAPVRLKVGDKFLNESANQMYPSPAMFDVDNDGQDELVVGDIFGSLNVYENIADSHGDKIWEEFTPLKTADGKAINVSNW